MPVNDTRIECLCALHNMYARCEEETVAIPKIYEETIANLTMRFSPEVVAAHFPPFNQVKTTMYNRRRDTMPTLPENVDEIVLPERYTETISHERFLLFDTNDFFYFQSPMTRK